MPLEDGCLSPNGLLYTYKVSLCKLPSHNLIFKYNVAREREKSTNRYLNLDLGVTQVTHTDTLSL